MRLQQLFEQTGQTVRETNWIEDYEGGKPVVKTRSGRDPDFVYRVMSRQEFENARKRGSFMPGRDGRIHASEKPEERYRNTPDDVVVRLRYDRRDGWRAKWGDKLYVITDQAVPFDRAHVMESQQINEVHYQDMFGDEFEQFHKKYRNMVRKNEVNKYEMFVQFTNHVDNVMDRTAFENPDHTDPMGVYSYPLTYVLSHPADIWYGASAKHLRVIRSTAKNPLHLKEITSWNEASRIAMRAGLRYDDRDLKRIRKYAQHQGNSQKTIARTLMTAIQVDFDGEPEESWGRPRYPMRPAKEQTQLLLKAGYDAVIDQGTGAIHEREPEQAIFLTRAAFRVVEVFDLHSQKEGDMPAMTNADPDSNRVFLRKFASLIADAIDDKLSGKPESSNLGGWKYIWTKQGRRIEIDFERPQSFYDRPIGEKPHKYDKKHTNHIVKVNVRTEYGDIERVWKGGDERIEQIAKQIGQEYDRMAKRGEQSDWEPEDKASFLEKMEAQRKLNVANQMRKEHDLPPLKSVEQIEELKAQGLNVVEEPFEQSRLKALIKELRPLNAGLKLDGLPTLHIDSFKELSQINKERLENKQRPLLARHYLETYKNVQVPDIGSDPRGLPFSFVTDPENVWYTDEIKPYVQAFLKKAGLEQAAEQRWESVLSEWTRYVTHALEHDMEPPTFREFLKQNYKTSLTETARYPTGQLHNFEYLGVSAYIEFGDGDGIGIYEFSSHNHGTGEAKKALKYLKRKYGYIEVIDPGDPDDPDDESFQFWKHMLKLGLVDDLQDENYDSLIEDAQRRLAGAAYLHKPTGKIVGPADTHVGALQQIMPKGGFASIEDEDAFYDDIYGGDWVDGFLTSEGKFLNREQAAKAVKLKPGWDGDAMGEPDRDWLDSDDIMHGGFDQIHENSDAYIQNEDELAEWQSVIFRDLRNLISSRTSTLIGAADLHRRRMNYDELFDFFVEHVMPIYDEFGYPKPGKGTYLEFQDAVKERLLTRSWDSVKEADWAGLLSINETQIDQIDQIEDRFTGEVAVVYNVTERGEIDALLDTFGRLRGMLSDKLYLWDANTATHGAFERKYGQMGVRIVIDKDRYGYEIEYDLHQSDKGEVVKLLRPWIDKRAISHVAGNEV